MEFEKIRRDCFRLKVAMNKYRSHNCGELKVSDKDKTVKLSGWVAKRRDHGGVIFIDLRDRFGITQIVFEPNCNDFSIAEKLGREFCVHIEGKVDLRKPGMENPKLSTGGIEVFASSLQILNVAQTPPFEIDDSIDVAEDLRLKFRYLDLRKPKMQKHLEFRHKLVSSARSFFNANGFLDIETPLLIKSTPEGARDYVVPSRVNLGMFYALPQSPQLLKQLLMVSGYDKYYQVAKCLRDEDLRADRQPEHTQFDFEMSFVEQEDVRSFVEGLYKHLFKDVLNVSLNEFPVISYSESMEKYSIDKPDIRFELFTIDVSDIVKNSDFSVFKSVVESGGIVKCINPTKDIARSEIDRYIEFCQGLGSKGMAWMRVTDNGLESNIAKFFSKEVQESLIKKTNAKPGSLLFFIADKKKACNDVISQLRVRVADDLGLIPKDEFALCWINDFPLFSYNEEEKKWEPEHHMFSMPKAEFVDDFESRPQEVLGDLWDLVLNGTELGSGSIRITSPSVQERVMNFVGFDKEHAHKQFGFLLDAYKYGAPPHGGMGLGVDRLCALMLGFNDIREVIAFPKNKSAQDVMMSAPSDLDVKQFKELHLKLDVVKKK